jgi:hypothetical protein
MIVDKYKDQAENLLAMQGLVDSLFQQFGKKHYYNQLKEFFLFLFFTVSSVIT